MTEPKQSFTEEVEKEAAERYKPFYNQSSYDENALRRSTFIEGANVALSILSRGGEGREFWLTEGYRGENTGTKYPPQIYSAPNVYTPSMIHVIEYSALVAERARNVELAVELKESLRERMQLSNAYADEAGKASKLESENAALKQQQIDYELTDFKTNLELQKELTTLRARADAFTELSNKLAAQLALCKEQRNYLSLYRANDQYDCSDEIKQYDLELQKKGQGDE